MITPLSTAGLVAFVFISVGALTLQRDGLSFSAEIESAGDTSRVRFIAVGDINLGRVVGQRILEGDTLFPFVHVRDLFQSYDIVFGNLECQLSDQDGETQHPGNNLIFTGPPGGAASLSKGGFTHVSTANNHALDYGVEALEETITNLRDARVAFAGTGITNEDLYRPLLFEMNGIRFAMFACTDVMNIEDRFWTAYVTEADSAKLFPRIRAVRSTVDFIFVSYHGGGEYSDKPSKATRQFAHGVLDAGADLFLGHHPHVVQGIEHVGSKLIVYSLGNFAFYQPFAFWTQRSFALEAEIRMDERGARIDRYSLKPLIASNQPQFLQSGDEQQAVHRRIDLLSRQFHEGLVWPN